MAGSSKEPWRRRPTSRFHADLHGDEPEEGEVVPGYHSDVDTEEYYNRHTYSSDSDETVSDSNAACSVPASYYDDATSRRYPVAAAKFGSAGASSVVAANNNASSSSVAALVMLPCPVCGKEFRSQKAVCGHMKVHQHGIGRQEQGIGKAKGIKRDAVVVGHWGGTGKRGCFGLRARAATLNAESDQSMAIVVAEPQIVFQPMPLAFAAPNLSSVSMASESPNPSSVSTASASPDPSPVPVAPAMTNVSEQSSSAQTMNAMDTVVAGAANPPSEAAVHLHHAPPAAGEQAPSIHQQPIAPPPPPAAVEPAPPAHQPPIAPRPAAERQNPNGYTCDECDMWFRTHQGLGGHMTGHKNRQLAAAAAGMLGNGEAAPSRRNARPEKAHACKVCGAVFPAGVQLGGHMRKHYAGPPIVPNKKPRLVLPLLPPPTLTLALSANAYADEASPAPAAEAVAQPGPTPAVERAPESAPEPAMAGRVLLFGIDIGVGMKKPAAQEGPSETEGSASTGGEQ